MPKLKKFKLGGVLLDIYDELAHVGINKLNDIELGAVEMHGAVGDGVTDDFESIQETLDSTLTVKLSKGKTYYVSKTLTLRSGHNIDMQGATIFVDGNYPVFTNTGIAVQKVRIFNGFFIGTATIENYQILEEQCGIKISCWNSSFFDLQFNNMSYGVYFKKRSSGDGTLVENKIMDTKFVSCYKSGFFTEIDSKTSDGFLKNIKVGGDGYEYAINIDNAGGWIIDSVHCYGDSQFKIRVGNCDNTCLNNLYLAGDYTNTGLLVHVYSNALISNTTIRGEKNDSTMLYCTASTSTTYSDKIVNIANISFSSKTKDAEAISVHSIKGYTKLYASTVTFNDPYGVILEPELKPYSEFNDLQNQFQMISDGSNIFSGSDLNNYTNSGNWVVSSSGSANGIANIPIAQIGRFTVSTVLKTGTSQYIIQEYLPYSTDLSLGYKRTGISSDGGDTWTFKSWKEIGNSMKTESISPLGNNKDVNTLTTPGIYATLTSASASSLINSPTTEYCRITVIDIIGGTGSTKRVKQYIEPYSTDLSLGYMRTGASNDNGTTWTFKPWKELQSV